MKELFFFGCITILLLLVIPSFTQQLSPPLIIGHRGASGYEPENTLRAFKRAIELEAGAIELDVHRCQTGELVVIHDDTVNRTTHARGKVRALAWDTLKKYDAGKGEHIPLLSEVFDLVDKRIKINIELKGPQTAEPVAQLINFYVKNKGWSYDHFIVTSFDHSAVVDFHFFCPQVVTGLLFTGKPAHYMKQARRAHATVLVIDAATASQKTIKALHKKGFKLYVYTVNKRSQAERLQKLGIEGIITNYPDILKSNGWEER